MSIDQLFLTAASLLVSFLIAYVFYSLQKRHSQSATVERALRAKGELIGVIEQHIINKKAVKSETIQTLINASERDFQVRLDGICTPSSLLQDVALRLQRSTHLDVQKKNDFHDLIDSEIDLSSKEDSVDVVEVVNEEVTVFAFASLIGMIIIFFCLIRHYVPQSPPTGQQIGLALLLLFSFSTAFSFPVYFVVRWWSRRRSGRRPDDRPLSLAAKPHPEDLVQPDPPLRDSL